MTGASTLSVRRLTPMDAPAYQALRRAMLIDAPRAFASSPEDDRIRDPQAVRAMLEADDQAVVGGFVDADLVAAAGLYRDRHRKMAHRAWIFGVWTQPAQRGRGLGIAVMRGAIDLARAWPGIDRISLSAGVGQHEAIRLYERLGFVAWGTEPGVVCVDGQRHDEVHMQLLLDRDLNQPPPGPRSP
ncbi:MAG: GNAT family N-acetyltransferase [Phycisphaeraceae bacterium]|nr:GNAT family N-acetyltransferase [Phycisphaeraceae bacterium]